MAPPSEDSPKKRPRAKRPRPPSASHARAPSKKTRSRAPLAALPSDLVHSVALFLDYASLASLQRSCSQLRRSLRGDRLWRQLYVRVWPIECAHAHAWRKVFLSRMRAFRAGRPFFCPRSCVCSRSFPSARQAETHARSHEIDEATGRERGLRHACAVGGCDRAFRTPAELRRHEASHSAPRQHACPLGGCDAAFGSARELRAHAASHGGGDARRPFACQHPSCGRAFARPSALRAHVAAHNGVLPFPCPHPGCGAAYSGHTGLKRHTASAHDPSLLSHRCSRCLRGFLYARELRAHASRCCAALS